MAPARTCPIAFIALFYYRDFMAFDKDAGKDPSQRISRVTIWNAGLLPFVSAARLRVSRTHWKVACPGYDYDDCL